MRLRRTVRTLAAATLGVAVAAGVVSSPADASGSAPNGYTSYDFAAGQPVTDLQSATTILADPGPDSQLYWATQFTLTDGHTGYFGLQTNGTGRRRFLFALWGSTGGALGDRGSKCETFEEGGSGYHCLIGFNWTQGRTYSYDLQPVDGGSRYRLVVTEKQTGRRITVGSLDLPDGPGIAPSSVVNWTEFYARNDPSKSFECTNFPHATARFDVPTTAHGRVPAAIRGTRAECADDSTITTGNGYSIQDLGIGQGANGTVGHEVDRALNRPVAASSAIAGHPGYRAVDDWADTSWTTAPSPDDQWLRVSMDPRYPVSRLRITWGSAVPASYRIESSMDGRHWTQRYRDTAPAAGDRQVPIAPLRTRYLRVVVHGDGTVRQYDLTDFYAYND